MYVLVVGPYDSTFIGPFPSESAADRWIENHLSQDDTFNFQIMTAEERQSNLRQFGACPTQPPETSLWSVSTKTS